MASPSDHLSLDYKPTANYSSTVQKGNNIDQLEQTQKLQDFLTRLEEERLKIEAFKRELPLCMQLLNNAVEAYRQQLEAHQSSQGTKPVLEEFIPIKQIGIEENEKESNNLQSEKSSWMVSAQLWNSNSSHEAKPQLHLKENDNNSFQMSPNVPLDAMQRNGGGAFLPFSKEKNKTTDSNSRDLPELALAPTEKECEEKKPTTDQMECNGGMSLRKENGDQQVKKVADGSASAPQAHRKARRCWSPDLHRRFVNALQILGGAQVATPKQIRELMKVDGLTNDEVKSHLQKYRLHTRRPIPAPQPPTGPAPHLVVLGGIWVPPEYATSAGTPAIYGAHPGPAPHYCQAAPMGHQEFYASQATAMAVPPVHQHHFRPGVNAVSVAGYKNRTGSPEAEVRSGGDRSESIEEEGEERDEDEEDDVAPLPETNSTGGGEVALKF